MFWLLQQIVISVFIIVLMHYFYNYLKDTLTTPMIKSISVHNKVDLEDNSKHSKAILQTSTTKIPTTIPNESMKQSENKEIISDSEENEMKDTLKNYIKELNRPSSNTLSTTNINSLPQTN